MLVKDAARQYAESTLDTYWNGVYPVNPQQIADAMEIGVYRAELPEDTSGFIRKVKGSDAEIFLSDSDSRHRQNFTLAHELGHYIERTVVQETPDEDFGFVDKRDGTTDIHEFFANEFAGNLLMPEHEVRRRRDEGWDTVRLAGHFGVSTSAMNIRLRRLGLNYA